MISIAEGINRVLSQRVHTSRVSVPVNDSLGLFLSEEVIAPLDLPGFDNSAMDGYAVCGEGTTYEIIGQVRAGDTTAVSLGPGQAYRIYTGAMLPANSTAVIMQEKTRVEGSQLTLMDTPDPGKNIRKRGEQIARGQVVFKEGQKINPSVIGMLNSLGLKRANVYAKPSISVLITGDELVAPGQPLKEGQIYESNGATLRAAIHQFGFQVQRMEKVEDRFESTKEAIGRYLEETGVLLLSGGISVGEYDFVRKALDENGVEEIFYKVRQRPGKPLFFGRRGETFVFALPGNPASALTCFYIYVLPLLQKIAGYSDPGIEKLALPLAHEYEMKGDRPSFLKASYQYPEGLWLLDGQGSSMLHSLAKGNMLALLETPGRYPKGTIVECYWLK